MKIEHVALWARDLDAVCSFYVDHLGATAGDLYVNKAKGFSSRFLTWDDGGARLEVMHRHGIGRPRDEAGWAHIALSLGSTTAVDEAAARLGGVPVVDGPRQTGDGYYECVVLDPEGNRVELTA